MKAKKLLALLCAALTVVAITGCKEEERETVEYVATNEDNIYLDHIDVVDMEGYNFRILTRPGQGWISDQYVEEQTGDIVSDAVYKRNETVKALFNIDITATESTNEYANDAINNILAGDDEYDIIFPHARVAFTYALQNTLVNFHEISTIDTSKEWWSQDIIDSCSVNGHLYVLDGDISTKRLYYAYNVFFNKRIFDDLGLEYPYQMVRDGTWTFDAFAKLVKQGSKDLNGDGVLSEPEDQFGYYAIDWYAPFSVLYGGGQRIYSKDATGIPKLSLNTPKTIEIFSKFFNLANTDDVYMRLADVRMPSSDLFRDGKAMFADKSLGEAKNLRDMSDEFGILPYPKFSDDDTYITLIGGGSSLMVMPVTVSDYEATGKIVEALCALGSRDVIPAFYDVSLKTKFARDYDSEEMIDTIKNSLVYDLGYLSGSELNSPGFDLAHMSNPDFASYYAQRESKALSDLDNFLLSYGKIG